MATLQEAQQLQSALSTHLDKDPRAILSETQRNLIKRIAEELVQTNPKDTAAKTVLEELTKRTDLQVSDGLALVGQLVASLSRAAAASVKRIKI